MAKPTIADVLHLAADEFLWIPGVQEGSCYSCDAVRCALKRLGFDGHYYNDTTDRFTRRVFDGLAEMGLNCQCGRAFDEFKTDETAQAARYAWMKFAALIAEEQGV